jgi:hypothetical protein
LTGTTPSVRRRRTRRWFVVYTVVLLAIVGFSIADHQWSVAATTLAIAILFALFTRRLWRKR